MFSFTALPWFRRWFGDRSERAALSFLKRKGYRLLAKNFRCNLGELDLVMRDGSAIVFIEVRSTEGASTTRPSASVDIHKQRKLTQLALFYLKRYRLLEASTRFDVISVAWPASQKEPTLEHHVSAFEAVGRFQMYS